MPLNNNEPQSLSSRHHAPRALDADPTLAHTLPTTKRALNMQCATCPSLALCPPCGKGQMCQLSVPPSCAECPKNTCVDDPTYTHHGPSAGSIGGGVGGVLAALALAGLLFWLWRKRHQRAKQALRRARLDAKLRLASSEKFRPGAGIGGAFGTDKSRITNGDGITANGTDADSARNGIKSSSKNDLVENEEEADEEDVEWTELREDGLTAFRKRPGQESDMSEQDAAAFKRRSVGAATHLSRITEGAEDDEDAEEENRFRRSRNAARDTIVEESEIISSNQHGPSSSNHLSVGYFGSDQGRTHARRSAAGRELSNPFADWSETGSMTSGTSMGAAGSTEGSTAVCSSALEHGRWSGHAPSLEPPSRVHRPVGAPLIDLHGKPKSPGYSGMSPALTPSSPSRNALSPNIGPQSLLVSPPPPNRPARMPDLNLRLEDGTEPGKIGDDLRKHRITIASSFDSRGDRALSPAAPSTPSTLHFDNHRNTLELEQSEIDDYPTELAKSDVYSKSRFISKADKRMSALTTGTTGTVDTVGTLEYVMSAPQIVTAFGGEGAKRMQLKQGKAQLVRSLSAIRKEQEELRVAQSKAENLSDRRSPSAGAGTIDEARSIEDPFSDSAGGAQSQRSSMSHNTFGQAVELQRSGGNTPLGGADATPTLPAFAQRALSMGGMSIMTTDGNGRPQSSMTSASLPFVDRPMMETLDRSPTDAHPRESIATFNTLYPTAHYRPSMLSELDTPLGLQRGDSSASSLRPYGQSGNVRQSSTSIGGLSVFDEIPFHIGRESVASASSSSPHMEILMPEETRISKVQEAKRRNSSTKPESSSVTVDIAPTARSSSVSAHPRMSSMSSSSSSAMLGQTANARLRTHSLADISVARPQEHENDDMQPEASPFHNSHIKTDSIHSIGSAGTSAAAADKESIDHQVSSASGQEMRRFSVPTSLIGEQDDADAEDDQVEQLRTVAVDDGGMLTAGQDGQSRHQQGHVRVSNPDFEQIRLRHELDNYPFTNDA